MKKSAKVRMAKYGYGSSSQGTDDSDGDSKGAGIGQYASLIPAIGGLIETLADPPQYSRQPTMNAMTMRNMVSPYNNFAYGGDINDLDEDELADLQEKAQEAGMSVEDYYDQMSNAQQDETGSADNEQEDTDDEDDSFAMGGKVKRKSTSKYAMGSGGKGIEVEGNEVVETPDGTVKQMKGPSHEQGGIDIKVPHGTKVFSDRLAVDGKSMQQRKLTREKRLAKLDKLVSKNPGDKLLRNTYQTTMSNAKQQEHNDMVLQSVANKIYAPPTAGGDNSDGSGAKPKMAYGTPPYTDKRGTHYDLSSLYGMLPNATADWHTDTPEFDEGLSDTNPTSPNYGTPVTPLRTTVNKLPTDVDNPELEGNHMTTGDYIGMAGNMFNAIAPIINTNNNRAATKPNINRFKGFGRNALNDNTSAQTYVAGQQADALTDIDTAANSQVMRNRNSATSVNTLRGLDIATDMAKSKSKTGARDSFSREMMSLLGQRAGLDNEKDKVVMSGEQQRDMEDKADTDNYYSNMAQNLVNFGSNAQGLARNMNKASTNKANLNLLANESKNNIAVTDKGNVVNKFLSPAQIQAYLDKGWTLDANGKLVRPKKARN